MSIEIKGQATLESGNIVYLASVDGVRQEFVSNKGPQYVMERVQRDRETEAKFQAQWRS